jgi:hypothetical protein
MGETVEYRWIGDHFGWMGCEPTIETSLSLEENPINLILALCAIQKQLHWVALPRCNHPFDSKQRLETEFLDPFTFKQRYKRK